MNRYWVVLLMSAGFLAGCASSNSGSVYSRGETRQVQQIKMGVVESVRTVKIEGTDSKVGTVAGGVVGGVVGKDLGGDGKSGIVGAVIGAVAGAVAGSALEEVATRKDGLEITVKLDNGSLVAIVQEGDEQFRPGERVRLLESGGVTRVSH